MINEKNFSHLFSDFVIADSNPFKLSTQETYKEGGELKSKTNDINIDLAEVNSPIDLILTNNNFEIVEYYPNTFLKKLFRLKNSDGLKFDGTDNHFVFMSEKTSKIFKTNCKVYPLQEDNKVIIGRRSMIIIHQKDEKYFMWSDPSNYKTILIR
jgi:hypothetical protein